MTNKSETFNEGMYADANVAKQWIAWVENLVKDTRDEEIYPWLSQWIAQHKPKKILEIGSGQGVCSEKVALGDTSYIGVEPSAHLRARAHELYPTRTFVPGVAEELPLPDSSVDAVFSVFVWFHLAELEKPAAELSRVLNPKGAFAVVTGNPEHYDLWESWQTNVTILGKELRGNFPKMSNNSMFLHTTEEYKKAFENHGLTVTRMNFFGTEQNNSAVGAKFAVVFSGNKI